MNTENQTPETESGPTGRATYEPESNRLRLYIGRVPREEYLKLTAEGWKALHKQREAGGGDFVALWTPTRRDTALAYSGGVIDDEDMSMAERAADRAERFAGYRGKRIEDATGHADRFDAGPHAHGFQSQARAERSAARHDRIAGRAVDAWDKAEYWQSRTAGVISHALHISSPEVRMGRIKELESEIRKCEKARDENEAIRKTWQAIAGMTDAEAQTKQAQRFAGAISCGYNYTHPRHPERTASLWSLMDQAADPITGAEAAAIYLAAHPTPTSEGSWLTHYRLRLAYENQMLEAQGGRAGVVEMVAGGFIQYTGRRARASVWVRIQKVNKSPASGRVTSVMVKATGDRWGNISEGFHLAQIDVERMAPECYRAPTAEELAAFEAETKAAKKAAKTAKPVAAPLVNPTDADAERLQAAWNEKAKAQFLEHNPHYRDNPDYFQPSKVVRITQATYSVNSAGSYARASVADIAGDCELAVKAGYYVGGDARRRQERVGPCVVKVRTTYGNGNTTNKADSVIIITDKPQKGLPAAVWLLYVAPDSVSDAGLNAAVQMAQRIGLNPVMAD